MEETIPPREQPERNLTPGWWTVPHEGGCSAVPGAPPHGIWAAVGGRTFQVIHTLVTMENIGEKKFNQIFPAVDTKHAIQVRLASAPSLSARTRVHPCAETMHTIASKEMDMFFRRQMLF